jgi:hypothetical protein
VTFEQALRDRRLLGGLDAFRDLTTWTAWLAFARAVYGLPMSDGDRALFRQHTGRLEPRAGGYPEAVAVVGVQSGKSRFASAIVDHAALIGARGTYALLLGQDHRGAMRTLNELGEAVGSIRTAWRATCRRAHVSNLHFHDLRREFGSRLLESSADLHDVRDFLGHANITTTSRYLRSTPVRLERALAKLDPPIRTPFAQNDERMPQAASEIPPAVSDKLLVQ